MTFFINVGPSLSNKITPQNSSPDDYIKIKAVYSLYLEPVTEITKLVTSLKSAAPGYDNLRSSLLKLSLPFICTPLTYLSNLSLQEGVSLMSWKLPMWYHCLNVIIQNYSIIIDQCLCYALCQRSLRKLSTIGCEAFLMNTKLFFPINLDFANIILHIWF